MPIMHVLTDSKVPMLKKCNIPVNDMNKRYTWYLYRGSKESHSDKGHALSTALAVHYALGCT